MAGCTENIPTDVLKGKRECYGWFFPDDGLRERLLVIVGSDKRGTIYGLFHLSEIFGVSPVCELVSCGAGASG